MSAGLTAHWRAMAAIMRRDFAIFMSYRGRLVEQVLASIGMILIFNFTAKLVNVPQFKTHGEYFAFVVVGIVSLQVLTSTLTTPASLTGIPALAMPYGKDSTGLTCSVQLHARDGDEATLFSLGAVLEER